MSVRPEHTRTRGELVAAFLRISRVRAAGGYAPVYQRMADGVAGDEELLAIAAAARRGQNPPSLLFAAAQFLLLRHTDHPLARFYPALTGNPSPTDADPYPLVRAFVLDHRESVRRIVATRLVQTNEPARTTYLYPALLEAQRRADGRPLALVEIGPAAGLTLVPDRYRYDYGTGAIHGDPDSPLTLTCQLRGDLRPILRQELSVAWRSGIDLNPLNVTDADDRDWLRSLIWPDHPERARRLDQAARAATRGPLPIIHQGDAIRLMPAVLDAVPADAALTIYHTAVLAHFTPDDAAAFTEQLRRASLSRPITWIRAEPRPDDEPRLRLTHLEGGTFRQDQLLGHYHPHGEWLQWTQRSPSGTP